MKQHKMLIISLIAVVAFFANVISFAVRYADARDAQVQTIRYVDPVDGAKVVRGTCIQYGTGGILYFVNENGARVTVKGSYVVEKR